MPGLTIAKNSGTKPLPPSPQAVNQALEVARTPEAIEYLEVRFGEAIEHCDKSIRQAAVGMQEKIKERGELVKMEREANGDPWSGDPPKTDFLNMHDKIAEKASAEIKQEVAVPIQIDVAINKKTSQFIRGFSAQGQGLGAAREKHMDQLLNAFLSNNNVISKNSTFYEANENGAIKREGGRPKIADPQRVEQLLNDQKQGFAAFLEKQGMKVAAVNTHNYPETPKAEPVAAQPEGERPGM